MKYLLLGLTFLTSSLSLASDIEGRFIVTYVDESQTLVSSNFADREAMINLTEGKGNYKYALRAAVVSTSELKQDTVLEMALKELATERKMNLHTLQVTVERTEDNVSNCAQSEPPKLRQSEPSRIV